MPNEHPPVDPQAPGIVNLLARASLTWLKTLEIAVSMAALSSARLFPGGNAASLGDSRQVPNRCIQFGRILKNKPLLLLLLRECKRSYVENPGTVLTD